MEIDNLLPGCILLDGSGFELDRIHPVISSVTSIVTCESATRLVLLIAVFDCRMLFALISSLVGL